MVLLFVASDAYEDAVIETIFVIAAAPVMPVVLLRRSAEMVPDETDRPPPTMTATEVLEVAAGRRAAGNVPDEMFVATVVSVVALAANPDTAEEGIATAVDPAAVRRPAASTVNVATDDADP